MSQGDPPQQEPTGQSQPSEEELRQRVEEQLRKVRVQDLLLESVAGIVNLTARRIAKEDERDLEQARIGIDAVRAVVDLLEPEPGKAVREALSELQVLFARETAEAKGGGSDPQSAETQGGGSEPESAETRSATGTKGSDPNEPPPRLWTPPGSA